MTRRPSWPGLAAFVLTVIEPVVIAVTTFLAGLSFAPFYGGAGWLPAMAGAVLLGSALAVLSVRLRWPWWLTTLTAVGLFLVGMLYVGYREAMSYGLPGLRALRALAEGFVSGWARMLTVAPPADVVGDLLITPLVLAFVAALASSLLALRTGRVIILTLGPLLLFVTGLLFTAPHPGSRLLLTGAVLVALLLLLLVRSNRVTAAAREGISEGDAVAVGLDLTAQRWHSTLGRVAFGLPVIAVVTALGVLAAGTLPIAKGTDRFDPRELKQQQFRLAASLTPLVRVKPQLETQPPAKLFTLRASQHGGSYNLDRVRVAALDSFDGALWTQSRDFVVTGATLPAGSRLLDPVVTIDLDVQVDRLPDPFLPVAGRAVRVSAEEVAFDPRNGTLVSTRPTVAGYRYRVSGQVRPLDAALQRAEVNETPAGEPYTRLPDPPSWLIDLANQVTDNYRTPYTQLQAIEKYLTQQGYSLSARPGHSYGAVHRTLAGQPEERAGYAEQFASAFAILARAKHYPTRVAVGYRLSPQKRQGDVYQVDTADAHAWPEVHLAGFGWVPFEPTNTKNPVTSTSPRDRSAPVLSDDPGQQQVREPEADAGNGKAGGATLREQAWLAAVIAGTLVLTVILLLAGVVLAKLVRRRRRARRGHPADRVAAAWRETTDRLRERGVRAPPSSTPIEISREAAAGPSAPSWEQVAELALIATTAVCAPFEPPEEAVTRSWELEAQIRKILTADAPLLVRIRSLLDPRPLVPARTWLSLKIRRHRAPQSHETAAPGPREGELSGSGGRS